MCVTRSFDTFLTCLLRSKLLINSLFIAPPLPAPLMLFCCQHICQFTCCVDNHWWWECSLCQLMSRELAPPAHSLATPPAARLQIQTPTQNYVKLLLSSSTPTMSSFYSSPWRRIMKSYYSNQFLLQLRGESEYMTWIHFPLKLNLSFINTE